MLFNFSLFAENDLDSIFLPEVTLIDSKVKSYSTANHIENINSDVIGNSNSYSLSDLLSSYTSFYMKQYGSLSTPTFRGTSSSHTLLLWNGIALNSLANGLIDFSIAPYSNNEKMTIKYGGDGSVYGSGAIGGSIHLDSDLVSNSSSYFSYELGSYGFSNKSLSAVNKNNKLSILFFISELEDENNFRYINTSKYNNPLEINNYGSISSDQKKIYLDYIYNKNNIFSFKIWSLNNIREVVQNLTVSSSDAMQYDNSDRFLFSSKNIFSDFVLKFKYAYLIENFRYTELSKNINSYYNIRSHIVDMDINYFFKDFLLNFGTLLSNNSIENNNYTRRDISTVQTAVFSSIQYKKKSFKLNASIRKEFHSDFNFASTPTFSLEKKIADFINFRLKYNSNFRIPSFNDRYWNSGSSQGNINLVPESSYNYEIGFDIITNNILFRITGYNLDIKDMIVWQNNNSIWQPLNINSVLSQGLETSSKIRFHNFTLTTSYNFTKSINTSYNGSSDNSYNKQLRYVPVHKSASILSYKLNKNIFSLIGSYTGRVITSYGLNSNNYLDAFFLVDFYFGTGRDAPIVFDFKLKNCLNKHYQTYLNYPNPGREYLITLTYNY